MIFFFHLFNMLQDTTNIKTNYIIMDRKNDLDEII